MIAVLVALLPLAGGLLSAYLAVIATARSTREHGHVPSQE